MLLIPLFAYLALAVATPLIWDGRAPFNLDGDDLNNSIGPFLT